MNNSRESLPILVMLVPRFPFPLEKGDKLRAFYQIRELSNYFNIILIAISEKSIEKEAFSQLETFCSKIHVVRITKWSILIHVVMALIQKTPLQIGYFFSLSAHLKIKRIIEEEKPNYIYSQLIRVTEYVKNYHSCPKTLDYMDVLSMGIERRISKSNFIKRFIFEEEAKRLKKYERSIFEYFENKIIISEQDRNLIPHPENNKIHVIPNGIDSSFFHPFESTNEFDLVFVGNLNYQPNVEAVEFISEILKTNDKLTCLISGATPSSAVQRICQSNQQISLQGWVEDIRSSYCRGKIFVAPMFIGTGMQNKLLESMALGIPCITTSLASNAIKGIHDRTLLIANNRDEFIFQINRLLTDKSLYQTLAENARDFVRAEYSWEESGLKLSKIIKEEK